MKVNAVYLLEYYGVWEGGCPDVPLALTQPERISYFTVVIIIGQRHQRGLQARAFRVPRPGSRPRLIDHMSGLPRDS